MRLGQTTINQAGVFRCCPESLVNDLGDDDVEVFDEDTHVCPHCGAVMQLKDGVWSRVEEGT